MGHHFGDCAHEGVMLAKKTWSNHQDRLTRLDEQGASQEALGEYGRRWGIWVRSGVQLVKRWDEGMSADCGDAAWTDVPFQVRAGLCF